MDSRNLIVIFLLLVSVSSGSLAKELTIEDITSATKIAFIPGTFDPFTKGHMRFAEGALSQGGMDLVIFLPTISPPHKDPLPIEARLMLIDQALHDSPKISYPFSGHFLRTFQNGNGAINAGFVREIRRLNPKAEVYVALGGDVAVQSLTVSAWKNLVRPDGWLINPRGEDKSEFRIASGNVRIISADAGLSSTEARTFFTQNPALYFKENVKAEELPLRILDENVARTILRRGFYLDQVASNKMGPGALAYRKLKSGIEFLLDKFNLMHSTKKMAVRLVANKSLQYTSLDGRAFKLKKYLGSGMTSDVYLIEMDGKEYALKVANRRTWSATALKQSLQIYSWAYHKKNMNVPRVMMVDPDGRWVVSEFIEGINLEQYMAAHPNPPVEFTDSLRRLFQQVQEIYSESFIKLDLGYDNIIVRDDKAFLVDLGEIPRQAVFPKNFEEFYKRLSYNTASHSMVKYCAGLLNTVAR